MEFSSEEQKVIEEARLNEHFNLARYKKGMILVFIGGLLSCVGGIGFILDQNIAEGMKNIGFGLIWPAFFYQIYINMKYKAVAHSVIKKLMSQSEK
ncbi:MAG: hypothetical protein HOO93_00075 [Methyloglobulus sp.]|nr:hypothetical protein [Methyloglobulus sp.]